MPVETINCPNCGAPLGQQPAEGPWICVYCSALIRTQDEEGRQGASLQRGLDGSSMQEVKQLLVTGRRREALERYQKLSGADAAQAGRILDQMAASFSMDTLFQQQLTAGGIVVVLISLVVLPASLYLWWRGMLLPWQALVLGAVALFELFAYGRGALTTLRYWNAPTAPAATLHCTHIGEVMRGRLHTFKVVLEVRPPGEPPFQAETVIPVREEHLDRVRQGAIIQVKYLPGKPESVIYNEA